MSLSIWAGFGKEVAKVVGNWQNSKDRNRLLYRLEAAQNYVFVNERDGEYKDVEPGRAKKLLLHFRKRIFDSS